MNDNELIKFLNSHILHCAFQIPIDEFKDMDIDLLLFLCERCKDERKNIKIYIPINYEYEFELDEIEIVRTNYYSKYVMIF
jgi:hypothetical protein